MEAGVIIVWIIAITCMAVGFAGLILPVIPGPLMIFSGMLLAAWAGDFLRVGGFTIAVLAVLALTAASVDLVAGALGAKGFGASRRAMVGAAIGAVAGLFFGLPGIIAGPFLGAVIGELSAQKDIYDAGLAGIGAWLGLAIGAALKITIGFIMLGIFLISFFGGRP